MNKNILLQYIYIYIYQYIYIYIYICSCFRVCIHLRVSMHPCVSILVDHVTSERSAALRNVEDWETHTAYTHGLHKETGLGLEAPTDVKQNNGVVGLSTAMFMDMMIN